MNTARDKQKYLSIEEEIENSFEDHTLQTKLMNYAYKLTRSTEDAEDLVQQTRHNVWKKKDDLNRTNPQALLMKIIKNQFINQYRKKQHTATTNIDEERKRDTLIQDTAQNNAESNFSVSTIQAEINNLEERVRLPLELYIQKHKYEEIAKILDTPIGTIKSRIFIARQELAIALIKKDKFYDPFIRKKSSPKPSESSQGFPQ